MIVLLIRFEALPSVRIAVHFCFPFCGHGKQKIPRKGCVPAVGNDGNRVVRDGSSVEAAARILAATFSGGAARGHTASDVVAGEYDLEVVGDE